MDMNYWLGRKYALLQQQADANTANAAATTRNAATNALTGKAAALLDSTRANLMPTESKANVGQTRAQTGLINEQAAIVAPESAARIAQMNAETSHIGTQDAVLQREGLMTRTTLPSSLQAVMGSSGVPRFSLGAITPVRDPRLSAPRSFSASDPLPARRAGESEAAYLDRINS